MLKTSIRCEFPRILFFAYNFIPVSMSGKQTRHTTSKERYQEFCDQVDGGSSRGRETHTFRTYTDDLHTASGGKFASGGSRMTSGAKTKSTSGTRLESSQKRSRVIKATEGGHNTVTHEKSYLANKEGLVSPRTSALI